LVKNIFTFSEIYIVARRNIVCEIFQPMCYRFERYNLLRVYIVYICQYFIDQFPFNFPDNNND